MKFCGQCRYFSISIQKSTSFFCQELPHKRQVLSESRLQPPLIWTLRLRHHSVTFLVCRIVTHLSALFVIVGFTPSWNLLVTWSMSLTSASPGSSGHICSSLCPVSSLEPGNGRTNTYRVSWHALTSPSPIARVQSLMFPSLFVIYFSQVFVIFWQLASAPSWFYCGV